MTDVSPRRFVTSKFDRRRKSARPASSPSRPCPSDRVPGEKHCFGENEPSFRGANTRSTPDTEPAFGETPVLPFSAFCDCHVPPTRAQPSAVCIAAGDYATARGPPVLVVDGAQPDICSASKVWRAPLIGPYPDPLRAEPPARGSAAGQPKRHFELTMASVLAGIHSFGSSGMSLNRIRFCLAFEICR